MSSEENLLGEFIYTYDGVTNRLATVTYPNGQTSTYTYLNNAGDRRLQTIHHKYPNASTLSKFDYTYDAVGNILTWRQQADGTAVMWKYAYDSADQLIAAVKHATDTNETVLQRFAYAYDPAGNRTVEQIDDAVTLSAYDNLNRLTSQALGGPMVIAGVLNEPGTVTISGVPATVDSNNNFRGTVPTTSGTNAFTIAAKDANGNTTTQRYEVDLSGSTKSFTYDANGNVISDGSRTFAWNGQNALIEIASTGVQVVTERDGRGRLVTRIVEEATGIVSNRTFTWCGVTLCSDSDSSTSEQTKRFAHGVLINSTAEFAVRDQLESVRARTSSSGTNLATIEYDPYGRPVVNGSLPSLSAQFSGHQFDDVAALYLTLTRAYDPQIGRWLSEDPAGFSDGPNLYGYVAARVIVAYDPFGLQSMIGPLPPPNTPPPGCTAAPWRLVSTSTKNPVKKFGSWIMNFRLHYSVPR